METLKNRIVKLLDTLNEYSPQFAALGLSADQFIGTLVEGADAGLFSIDKVGDAVKEFNIRAKDGSDTSREAFESLGLNADKMFAAFAAGGDTAEAAFFDTVEALNSMDDPLARNAAGVALFGTQFEDLEAGVLPVLASIETAAYDGAAALQQINDVKYNDLGSAFEAIKRSAEVSLLPMASMIANTLTALAPILRETFEAIAPVIMTLVPPLMQIVEALLPPLMSLLNAIMPILSPLLGLLQPIASVLGTIASVIGKIVSFGAGVINSIAGLFGGGGGGGASGFATGGFTSGPSIAGEDPRYPTEAVISFNPAYRAQNLSYWARAGEMLGAMDEGSYEPISSGSGTSVVYDLSGLSFSPTIKVDGNTDEDALIRKLRDLEPEFIDFILEALARREGGAYVTADSRLY